MDKIKILQKLKKRRAYLFSQAIYLFAKEENWLKAREYGVKFLKALKEMNNERL